MKDAAITKFFRANQGPQDYAYVLLDPLAEQSLEPVPLIDVLEDELGSEAITRVLRPGYSYDPRRCPALVCLAEPGNAPAVHLVAMTEAQLNADLHRPKRSVCGWLISEQPPDVIATHLLSLCMLPTGPGTTQFYPIFEPLRLELLWTMFPTSSDGPWWPIKSWWVAGSDSISGPIHGNPESTHAVPVTAHAIQSEAPLVRRLLDARRLTQNQQNRLASVRPSAEEPRPIMAAPTALKQLQQARELGLAMDEDLLTWALLSWYLHPNMHEHPACKRSLEKCINNLQPLAELLGQYSDGDWKRVLAEMTRGEQRP